MNEKKNKKHMKIPVHVPNLLSGEAQYGFYKSPQKAYCFVS